MLSDDELMDAFQSAPDGIAGLRAVEAAVLADAAENYEENEWYKKAVAYNVDRDKTVVKLDALIRAVDELDDDLDSARLDGTIYTYGQIQERLRAALFAAVKLSGTDEADRVRDNTVVRLDDVVFAIEKLVEDLGGDPESEDGDVTVYTYGQIRGLLDSVLVSATAKKGNS